MKGGLVLPSTVALACIGVMAVCAASVPAAGEDMAWNGRMIAGPPIIRDCFERCEPADALRRDENAPGCWNIRVADWQTYSAGHREWFYSDGIHPKGAGAAAYAALIRDTLRK